MSRSESDEGVKGVEISKLLRMYTVCEMHAEREIGWEEELFGAGEATLKAAPLFL